MRPPDLIIVGAGSAGCLLADGLAADRSRRIVVIEPDTKLAPDQDRLRPSHWLNLLGSSQDWSFDTEAVDSLAGRSLRWPRGRGLGGSSGINAMIWFPPTQRDFANLANLAGADAASMQAAFDQVQEIVRPEPATWLSDASRNFQAAAREVGYDAVFYQRVNRSGRRWNPAEQLNHPNIKVVRATVDQILIQNERAVGVCTSDGEEIGCTGSVFLCAGAITTPSILMRSGIGPREVLRDCGIDVRCESDAVGENLQDHLIMPVIFGVRPDYQFRSQATATDLREWEHSGSGPITSNIAETGGLLDDDQIQIHVTPTHYLLYPGANAPPAMTIGVNVTQPKSRGRLTLVSADPHAPPRIEPNYLASDIDLQKTMDAVRLARRIAASDCFGEMITGELLPGSKRESDDSLAKSVRRFSQTLYHPVGTASGVETGAANLHIVDASALKQITFGNPNAAVMTLARYVADLGC